MQSGTEISLAYQVFEIAKAMGWIPALAAGATIELDCLASKPIFL